MARHVMVIEDDEELNEVIQYNLVRAGYRVTQGWNGREAMEAIRKDPPDVVLLDVMLPGADGWEVCQFLFDDTELRRIPIVIFTAKSAPEDFNQARKYNLAGFFTKPYATGDVLRHIEKILDGPADSAGGSKPSGSS
jgi:two-component system phosphate regulon response regulator PhoB